MPKSVSGGVVEAASPFGNVINLLTYNTSEDPKQDSNATHAEHQLLAFLKSATELRPRIIGIEATISKSPCRMCTEDMVSIGELTPEADGNRKLTFEKWYQHRTHGTTDESIEDLQTKWHVDGPGVKHTPNKLVEQPGTGKGSP